MKCYGGKIQEGKKGSQKGRQESGRVPKERWKGNKRGRKGTTVSIS